jgi:glycosyltransferase involved in cell wall biosynthesis
MCESFSANGKEVELIVPKRKMFIGKDPFIIHSIRSVFKIKYLWCLDFFPGSTFFIWYWIRKISFLISSKLSLWNNGDAFIYSRDFFTALFFKNIFIEIHALPKNNFLTNYIFRKAKGIVAITSYIKEELKRRNVKENKILVSRSAIEPKDFEALVLKDEIRKKYNFKKDQFVIGYAGALKTLGMDKGISDVIKAVRLLDDRFIFVLAGGEKQDIDFYKDEARKNQVEERIHFLGRLDHKEVPSFLKMCDVLVAPFPDTNHFRYFMSPLKVFEYMASGVPIIVSDLPTMREFLEEKEVYFVRPDNFEDIASQISYISKNVDNAMNKAFLAKEKSHKFSWPERAKNIISFIEQKNG